MKSSNDDGTPSVDPIKAIFGPPPPRRPIPSNSFNTLVKILSLFPDQNPFSDYASNAELTESPTWYGDDKNSKRANSGDDSISARGENEASGELIVPASMEVCNLPLQNEASNGVTAEDFSINGSSDGLGMVMDELYQTTNDTKTTDKMASDEGDQDAQMADVQKIPEALSGIERIIMDELDDMGLLALPEKDVSSTFLNDFGSIWDIDVCMDNTMAAENSQTRIFEGNTKEDVAAEVKRKGLETNRSIGHVPKSQVGLSMDREISSQEETKSQHTGTCLEYIQDKDNKFCKENDANKLVESEGLTFTTQKSKNVGGIGNIIDHVGKGDKSDIANSGKTVKAKNASLKDVKSGKYEHISADGEAHNSTRSGGADQLIHGKMVKQIARGKTGDSSTKKVKKSHPESSRGFCYTREQLLRLRNMTSVSEDIMEALEEIGADLLDKSQHPAAEETRDSSVVKNKKRGSLSEAKKEKKKRQKRKKRAEMNKKLGVRRLKLKPVLKPKVVPPCRHYLVGRCQQGETCNFSHDLIPLTKSKPCCHFARNACMKGDDCPFDHQLSKYPCTHYVDTGFCIRGDSCSFSHKVSATEGSKCETNSLLKHDELNPKHQLNASFSTPNSLEDSARQASLPAITPKGLSFLSFGKSSAEDSAKPKETEPFQQHSSDALGICASPNIAAGTDSRRNDDRSATSHQLNQGISSKLDNVCQIKGNLAPISSKESDLSSSIKSSYVSSGSKSQATELINEHQIREKGTANETDKLKAVIQSGSPTSSGQFPLKVGGARSKPNSAQRALLSTLAFAEKFESGIKKTSVAPSKELNKDGKTAGDNKCNRNEELKASTILDFLYSRGNKEK